MAELRGAGEEPEDGDASARRLPADGDDACEIQSRHEPSPRAEYADAMRQLSAQANAPPPDASPEVPDQADTAQENADQPDAPPEDAGPEDPGQPDTDPADTGEADADSGDAHQADDDPVRAEQAETDETKEDSIAAALERFDPRRAGLPEVSRTEAAAYIEEHQADRPWLATARDCSPDAQRVIAAIDQGQGHALIRHGSWITEEMIERRVRKLEDPAQLDPDKREDGIDGLKNGNHLHRCGSIATQITELVAFATAFARGVERPEVRTALESSGPVPKPVTLPISDVLGEDGHRFCSGWQLKPVNGSMDDARANRKAWVAGDRSVPEPRTRPVETFEGGTITYVFRPSAIAGNEVGSMYVYPPTGQPT